MPCRRRQTIFYTFNGEKLRKTVENNGVITKTDYCGPFVYETVSGTRSLKYIITPFGRAVKNGALWDYEYNMKDHLGNVRVVIHKGTSGTAEVLQERHYYPFGMEMSELSYNYGSNIANKYLYNGKEMQNDYNLYWYDYGARFYDPMLGRWHTPDSKAEKYFPLSPYVYCLNNPLIFVDPDGKDVEIVIGKPYTKNGKEHPYGHMAIRVHGKGYNYVFDFGRYGKTWGLGGGEGILNVYTAGSKYMENEQRIRESVGFNLSTTSAEDKKVIDYYTKLAKDGEVSKTTKGLVPNGGGTSYKLDEDYSVFSNNCVTKSAEGVDEIGKNKIGSEIDPREVLENFEKKYEKLGFSKTTTYLKGGGTKVTYERKKEEEDK